MTTFKTQDSFIVTLLESKFHNDKSKFSEAIKELFQKDFKAETREYNLLKAYDRGELSIGQVSKFLNISKLETMELLAKYNIPFIRVDKEYLDQEFNAFS